jgi:glutathione S-transferase
MLALYHNDMSLCAQKVRVCLAEKKLAWEDRHIVLRSGDHQKANREWENPDYLALMQRRGREEWPKVREIMRAA